MLTTLFGDIIDGRLRRLPFLGWIAALQLTVLLTTLGIVVAIFGAEALIETDLEEVQRLLRQYLSGPFVLGIGALGLLYIFIQANLLAKRARDIGFAGWFFLAMVVVGSGLVSYLVSEKAANWVNLLAFTALLVLPTDLFSRTKKN
jgi:uncharacterized membrane protein YhaH (DUF805 family)